MIRINNSYSYEIKNIPFIAQKIKYMDIYVYLHKHHSTSDAILEVDEIYERTWEPNLMFKLFGSTYEKRIKKTTKRATKKAINLANIRFENENYAKKLNQ